MEIPKERWDSNNSIEIPTTRDIDCFLAEYIKICKKYNVCLSHEDGHGAFEIEKFNEDYVQWVLEAHDNTKNITPKNQKIEDERKRLSDIREANRFNNAIIFNKSNLEIKKSDYEKRLLSLIEKRNGGSNK